jgi:hypothetical protein
VRLFENFLVDDVYLTGHKQAHVLNQVGGKLVVRYVASRYVQPETLRRQATSVGEVDDEIKLCAVFNHACLVVQRLRHAAKR